MQLLRRIREYFSLFINNPVLLMGLYILVNMIPSILLYFTEPYNMAGKLAVLLSPLGLYIVMFSLFKNNGLLQLVLFPLLFFHAFQIVVHYLFGEGVIAADMFLNAITTNASEAGEILNAIWLSVVFVCMVYIPATAVAIYQMLKKIYLNLDLRKISFFIGFAILLSGYTLSFYAKDKNTGRFTLHENIYPGNMLYNLNFAIDKIKKSNNYLETSKDFSFAAKRDTILAEREIYVLVIGETSRASNWSMYGYERETTPLMQAKENLVHFPDAITQSNTTHKSVSIMLSAADAENYETIYGQKGILDAFKEVGFYTVFLSNQGENNTFTEYFGKAADRYHNLRATEYKQGLVPNRMDLELVPLMKHYMDSISQNMFILLHTYGSHFNYAERYPEIFSKYKPDEVKQIHVNDREQMINAYDNTILYTDYVLSEITNLLDSAQINATILYCSDHGEDILDDERERFLHSSPSPTFYQLKVPMFLWYSDTYEKNFPEKILQLKQNKEKTIATNSIFHSLLDIASISTEYLEENLSLVNSSFKTRKRMYLNDHDNPVPYYKMNLKWQDIELIEENNMHK